MSRRATSYVLGLGNNFLWYEAGPFSHRFERVAEVASTDNCEEIASLEVIRLAAYTALLNSMYWLCPTTGSRGEVGFV